MSYFLIFCALFNMMSFIPYVLNSNTINIENKSINENNAWVKIQANYPKISGMENSSFQDKLNLTIEKKVESFVQNIEKQAKENYNILGKTGISPYEAVINYSYNINGPILSIIMDYYSFLGGAHGATLRETINLDTKKGSYIGLKDLFKDKDNYKEYILKNINAKIKENPENYFYPSIDKFNESNFYLSPDGQLIIFFNQYEIAPYVAGIVEFKMPIL